MKVKGKQEVVVQWKFVQADKWKKMRKGNRKNSGFKLSLSLNLIKKVK